MPRDARTLAQRFWAHIPADRDAARCWEWIGARVSYGYGNLTFLGKALSAHRVSWEINRGPIPDGMWVLHRCDNPCCVNPEHLFLGDRQANVRDMVAKGRARPGPASNQPRGEQNWRARLTASLVVEIRQRVASGETIASIARETGMSEGALRHVVKRRHWKHVA